MMETIELKVEGMHCTGCSSRLERVLNNLEGIESATVDLESKTAKLNFDNTKINLEAIKEAIVDSGFEVKGE